MAAADPSESPQHPYLLDISRDRVLAYIQRRLQPDADRPDTDDSDTADDSAHAEAPPRTRDSSQANPLDDVDKDLLVAAVRNIAERLSDPKQLVAEVKEHNRRIARDRSGSEQPVPAMIVHMLRFSANEFGALLEPDGDDIYKWRYGKSGYPVPGVGRPQNLEDTRWKDDITFLDAFQDFWDEVEMLDGPIDEARQHRLTPSELASEFFVLPLTPAWPEILNAIERLKDPESGPGPKEQIDEDAAAADRYRRLLKRNGQTAAYAVLLAAMLGSIESANSRTKVPFLKSIRTGLQCLKEQLRLEERDEDDKGALFESLRTESESRDDIPLPATETMPECTSLEFENWRSYVETGLRMTRVRQGLNDLQMQNVVNRSWETWWAHLEHDAWQEFSRPERNLDDLICASDRRAPAHVFPVHRGEMRLLDWSGVLYRALSNSKPDGKQFCPMWTAIPALRELGLPRRVAKKVDDCIDNHLSAFNHRQADQERSADLKLHFPSSAPDRRTALLIRAGRSSDFTSWEPSSRFGALLLSESEFESLPERLQRARLTWADFGFEFVVVEKPTSRQLESVRSTIAKLTGSPFTAWDNAVPLVAVSRKPVGDFGVFHVRRPVGVDSLFEQLIEQGDIPPGVAPIEVAPKLSTDEAAERSPLLARRIWLAARRMMTTISRRLPRQLIEALRKLFGPRDE